MRELVLKMSITLDGFVCGPNGEIDWIFRSSDPESQAWTVDQIRNAGAHIMGSRTFQDMAAFWPFSTEVFAAPMNDIPKVVFTSKAIAPREQSKKETTNGFNDAAAARATRGELPLPTSTDLGNWRSPQIASGDLVEDLTRLKREPGKELVVHGGARFAQSVVRSGLVDEYRFSVHPIALGHGIGLFLPIVRPIDLELVSATAFPSGTLGKIYRPKKK